MIAFIRARFPGTLASAGWPDFVANNWMDPSIPFSLAHFFKLSTFQQIDMSFFLFPEVEVNDPRKYKSKEADYDLLVDAVLKEVDRVSKPDWSLFKRCMICFAQNTDELCGHVKLPNGKLALVAVFDAASRFDAACQEVGHMFGLQHELGAWYYDSSGALTNEYGCPYSVMSGTSNSFERGPDGRLPGVQGPTNPARYTGPYFPTVHLYINQYQAVNPSGVFNHPDTVAYLPASYEHTPASVRLIARDAAIAAWPSRRTVLAVVPPIVAGGDTHFLELRRKDALYDKGIDNASVIILAANFFAGNKPVTDPSTLRIRYVDRIDIEGVEGDLDYHSFSGGFVVRVTGIDDDFGAVDLTVAGGNAWQSFSVTLDNPRSHRSLRNTSNWRSAFVAPCPVYAKDDYNYRVHTYGTLHVLRARSSGYEDPHYTWYLENELLKSSGSIDLNVQGRDINGHEMSPPAIHKVTCFFRVESGKLELYVQDALADISIAVRVVVNESSPGVMKNYYPDRSISTTVRSENLAIEWDGKYQADHKACWKTFSDVNTRFQEQERVGPRDPRPRLGDQIGVRELIRNLAERDPRSAYAVAAEVARRAGVPTEDVLDDVFRH